MPEFVNYAKEFLPRIIPYKLARIGLVKPPMPLTLTFSVTNICQSHCKTCDIWKFYKEKPERLKDELKIDEIEKIFKSMGHIYFLNISGGEPFLRKDLPKIIDLACRYLTPGIIHIPTNCLAPDLVVNGTKKILNVMKKHNMQHVPLTVKPSYDGVEKDHDKIRGTPGNWEKLMDAYKRLKILEKSNPNLRVGLGTVVSNYNFMKIKDIAAHGYTLDPDTYISEIAEERSELRSIGKPITPNAENYEKAITVFSNILKEHMKNKKDKFSKATESFRLVYYKLVVEWLKNKRQVIPCFGGITNIHLSPYGDIWPCCILAYEKSFGNLRDYDYNFKKLYYSKQANEIGKYIRNQNCNCPLANQAYSNILCNFRSVVKVLKNFLF